MANMARADDAHSPWPFRADYRTGEARGPVSGNMTFILRLWDKLIEAGHNEFTASRDHLGSGLRTNRFPVSRKMAHFGCNSSKTTRSRITGPPGRR